jgi:hypothetical protein
VKFEVHGIVEDPPPSAARHASPGPAGLGGMYFGRRRCVAGPGVGVAVGVTLGCVRVYATRADGPAAPGARRAKTYPSTRPESE